MNAITFGGTLYQTCNYASPGRGNERAKRPRQGNSSPCETLPFCDCSKRQIDGSLSVLRGEISRQLRRKWVAIVSTLHLFSSLLINSWCNFNLFFTFPPALGRRLGTERFCFLGVDCRLRALPPAHCFRGESFSCFGGELHQHCLLVTARLQVDAWRWLTLAFQHNKYLGSSSITDIVTAWQPPRECFPAQSCRTLLRRSHFASFLLFRGTKLSSQKAQKRVQHNYLLIQLRRQWQVPPFIINRGGAPFADAHSVKLNRRNNFS